MKRFIILLWLFITITSCAPIEHTSSMTQPLDQAMIVGVGDVVLRVEKQRDLATPLGRADLFGRKTNEGFSELRFAGVEPTGEIVLFRKDVQIVTNETTLSRSPLSITNGHSTTSTSGNYYGTRNAGITNGTIDANSNTSYSSTTLAPTNDYHVVVPAETIPIRLEPGENIVPLEGYLVEIIRAMPNSLQFRIKKQ